MSSFVPGAKWRRTLRPSSVKPSAFSGTCVRDDASSTHCPVRQIPITAVRGPTADCLWKPSGCRCWWGTGTHDLGGDVGSEAGDRTHAREVESVGIVAITPGTLYATRNGNNRAAEPVVFRGWGRRESRERRIAGGEVRGALTLA